MEEKQTEKQFLTGYKNVKELDKDLQMAGKFDCSTKVLHAVGHAKTDEAQQEVMRDIKQDVLPYVEILGRTLATIGDTELSAERFNSCRIVADKLAEAGFNDFSVLNIIKVIDKDNPVSQASSYMEEATGSLGLMTLAKSLNNQEEIERTGGQSEVGDWLTQMTGKEVQPFTPEQSEEFMKSLTQDVQEAPEQ